MRFAASLEIDLPADIIERSPTLWDACRALVGARVDLTTHRVRTHMEAATFLHQVRTALDALGIDNARFLVVDGVVVYEDAQSRPNDLPELMTAFADHVLVAEQSARELRICVEQDEAGLGMEIEAKASLEHGEGDPAAIVSVLGRVLDFAPRPDESADEYRRRIAPFVADPRPLAALQLQFTSFVARLEHALSVALPGASTRATVRALGFDGDSMGPGRNGLGAEPAPRPPPRAPPAPAPGGQPRAENTHSPARNFSLPLEQRIGAAVSGPPAFAVRLRKIEDLRTSLVDELALAERESLDEVPISVIRGIEALNRLVEQHNFAYPIERNLPIDAATGRLMLGPDPWSPLDRVSIDDLRREASEGRRAPAAR